MSLENSERNCERPPFLKSYSASPRNQFQTRPFAKLSRKKSSSLSLSNPTEDVSSSEDGVLGPLPLMPRSTSNPSLTKNEELLRKIESDLLTNTNRIRLERARTEKLAKRQSWQLALGNKKNKRAQSARSSTKRFRSFTKENSLLRDPASPARTARSRHLSNGGVSDFTAKRRAYANTARCRPRSASSFSALFEKRVQAEEERKKANARREQIKDIVDFAKAISEGKEGKKQISFPKSRRAKRMSFRLALSDSQNLLRAASSGSIAKLEESHSDPAYSPSRNFHDSPLDRFEARWIDDCLSEPILPASKGEKLRTRWEVQSNSADSDHSVEIEEFTDEAFEKEDVEEEIFEATIFE